MKTNNEHLDWHGQNVFHPRPYSWRNKHVTQCLFSCPTAHTCAAQNNHHPAKTVFILSHSFIHSFNHHIRSSAVSAQIKSFPKWSPVEWAWIENLYFSPTRISFLLNVSMILTIAWPSPSTLTPLLRQENILQLTHDRRLNRWLPHRPSLFSSKKLIQSAEVIFSKPTHDSR